MSKAIQFYTQSSKTPGTKAKATLLRPRHGLSGIMAYLHAHLRAIQISVRGFYTTPITTLMTSLALGCILLLPAASIRLLQQTEQLFPIWDQGTALVIYLNANLTPEQTEDFLAQLSNMPEIKQFTYQNQAQALTEFKTFADSEMNNALEILTENPLLASITLYPQPEIASSQALQQLNARFAEAPEVAHTLLDENWIQKLQQLMQFMQSMTWVLGMGLGIGVTIIVATLIRLVLVKHQDEIEVLTMIGATQTYIRRPFLYRGIGYGLLGGIMAGLGLMISSYYLPSTLLSIAQWLVPTFTLVPWSITKGSIFLASCGLLGWLGAWLAMLLPTRS
jgi:cell division transport system permease protein